MWVSKQSRSPRPEAAEDWFEQGSADAHRKGGARAAAPQANERAKTLGDGRSAGASRVAITRQRNGLVDDRPADDRIGLGDRDKRRGVRTSRLLAVQTRGADRPQGRSRRVEVGTSTGM